MVLTSYLAAARGGVSCSSSRHGPRTDQAQTEVAAQSNFELLRPGGPTGWPDPQTLEASVAFSELSP